MSGWCTGGEALYVSPCHMFIGEAYLSVTTFFPFAFGTGGGAGIGTDGVDSDEDSSSPRCDTIRSTFLCNRSKLASILSPRASMLAYGGSLPTEEVCRTALLRILRKSGAGGPTVFGTQ